MLSKISFSALFLACVIAHADTKVEPNEREGIAFAQMFEMGSTHSNYAASRKQAGKADEYSVLYNFLGSYLNLSKKETEQIMSISVEHRNEKNDLQAECRYWEIILLNRGRQNTIGPTSWEARGFPVPYIKRDEEILTKYINKVKLALGDERFNKLNEELYLKMSKFYGDSLAHKAKRK